MAGGAGSRLRPLTCGRPKPIVPIMNKPVMAHIVELLKKNGITDIGVTLQYLPEKIENMFGDGSEYGVNMQYFIEDSPLGTAGSVKNAEEFLDDTVVVISGDALTDIDLTKAIEYHKSKNTLCTLILKEVAVPLEYGIVVTDDNGKITRFLEKPSWGEVFSNLANTGIYILEPKALSYFEKNKKFDFSQDLFPLLMNEGNDLYGYTTNEYWCDVGDIGSYIQSHIDILENKVTVNLNEKEDKKGIFIGKNVDIDKTAKITGPVVIGDNCKIGKNVQIEEYTVLGENTVIDDNSIIKRSIIWPNTHIGSNARISAGILCYGNNLKSNVTVLEESVIGDECQLKDRAVIKSGVKIWPNKIIQTATSVNESIIWGTKVSRTLFGKAGITGEMNVEITPEYVSKLGLAYASILKPGSRFSVSSDSSYAATLLKTAMLAGIAVGVRAEKERKLIEVRASFPRLISKIELYELEEKIKRSYAVNLVRILPVYNSELFSAEYIPQVIMETERIGYVSRGFFSECKYTLEGNLITITIPSTDGAVDIMYKAKTNEVISNIIKSEFSIDVNVVINREEDGFANAYDQMLKNHEEMLAQIRQQSIERAKAIAEEKESEPQGDSIPKKEVTSLV